MKNNQIEPHRTWDIYDSSKIQTYQKCPRKYFYRYILGWAPKGKSVHLVFGSAWHIAMEYLLRHGYSAESIAEAYSLLEEEYRKEFDPEEDELNGVKTPANALRGLAAYVKHYQNVDHFEVLYTEVAGTVPVSDDARVHFRIDGIVRDPDKHNRIYVLEHKTAGRDSQQWRDQWSLSTQVGTYLHALYCMEGVEPVNVFGVVINGYVVRKNDESFIRIPVRKTYEAMSVWLWNINHYLDMIKWNIDSLDECSESDPIMEAFPMNTQSCTDYGGCPFHALCTAWPNPLQRCSKPPMDYEVTWWDPTERDDTAKKVVKL